MSKPDLMWAINGPYTGPGDHGNCRKCEMGWLHVLAVAIPETKNDLAAAGLGWGGYVSPDKFDEIGEGDHLMSDGTIRKLGEELYPGARLKRPRVARKRG